MLLTEEEPIIKTMSPENVGSFNSISISITSSTQLFRSFSWTDYHYSLQKLYLQEFDAIVSQLSSSITEGKGNDISDNAYCHKPFGKVEVGNVGEVEVGKVDVGKVKVGKVGQGEVSKVGKVEVGKVKVGKVDQSEVEVGKAGKKEVCKIGKVHVGKLGTAHLGNLDKPTSFNELEPHVGTS